MVYYFVTFIECTFWRFRVHTSGVRSCRPEAQDVYVSDSPSLVHWDTMLARTAVLWQTLVGAICA